MSGVTHVVPFVLLIVAGGCGGHPELWRHGGHTIVRDDTEPFELIQQYGPADKSANWGPMETIVRRIDGRTGKVLSQNRTWGRPEPQPDVVFGWKGEFVLFDADLVTFRRATNVFAGAEAVNPVEAGLEVASLNTASGPGPRHDLTLPGGRTWHGTGWLSARLCLRRLYPDPLVGPIRSEKPFVVYSVDLDRMHAAEIAIPQPADEADAFDDILVVKHAESLTAYSLQGARLWRVSALDGEHLPSHNLPGWVDQGADRRAGSPLFITTRGSPTERDSTVFARRASDGAVAWTKNIDGASPKRATSNGPYVIFVGSREYPTVIQGQPGSRHESHWWVWDQAGNEIAAGVEPAWKVEYAFQGGAAATRVGIAFDAKRSTLVVGTGLDAVLVRDGKVVRRLTGIPGEPLFLNENVLVCRDETSHFAVRLGPSP
jgi:hypothetical protein